MLIDYYITDGTVITPPQVCEGSIEEVRRIAIKDASINFPECLFGFNPTIVINVGDTRIFEYL